MEATTAITTVSTIQMALAGAINGAVDSLVEKGSWTLLHDAHYEQLRCKCVLQD
jgi:hypothetical protein